MMDAAAPATADPSGGGGSSSAGANSSNPSATPAGWSEIPAEMPELPEMFSIRRPKNLVAGISSGSKSFIKGSISGMIGLVAAPIVGGKDNGFQGFCTGLANGIVGAIALPLTGAAVASLQIGRGLVNSVEATFFNYNPPNVTIENRTSADALVYDM